MIVSAIFFVSAATVIIQSDGGAHHASLIIGGVMTISLIVGFFSLIGFMINLINNGNYRTAKNVIISGKIYPSYAIHHLYAGVILVDEESRKIIVNDSIVHSFDDVKSIAYRKMPFSENKLELGEIKVILKSGENPIKTVKTAPGQKGENDYHRLSNSLGFQ
jgi:hypothetical protein